MSAASQLAGYAGRDAVALALVLAEDADDSDEVANVILAKYGFRGDQLELVVNLAALAAFARRDEDEFHEEFYALALWKALR